MVSATPPHTRDRFEASEQALHQGTPVRAERRNAASRLARGLRLLGTFREGETELLLKQLTVRAGLSAGAAHRLSRELVDFGILDRFPGGFGPGPELAHLVLRATTWPALSAAAGPAAERLHGLSSCPVSLYLLSGTGLLPMWRLTSRPGVIDYQAVPTLPEIPSSLLPTLHRHTAVDSLACDGVGLLAPIRDQDGKLVAALSLSDENCGRLRRFGPALAATANEIGRSLCSAAALTEPGPTGTLLPPGQVVDSSVLARGVELLSSLRPGERSVRRPDIVDRVATPRSTAYRCLDDLLHGGALELSQGMVGLGRLVRQLAPVAVARCLPTARLRPLAIHCDATCWLTPVDPDLVVPLNGLVVRPRRDTPVTVGARALEWSLVAATVADVFSTAARHRRSTLATVTSADDLHATAVPVRHAGVTSCLTAITRGTRRLAVERLLMDLRGQEPLSA